MSEEKIIEHAHNAVHLVADKQKPWRKKVFELAEEVCIIIFAVSVTLAFHNWNDWRNERKMERDFLTGIREDLKKDAERLNHSVVFLKTPALYYDTLWHEINSNRVSAGYIDSNSRQLLNTIYYAFDNGLFEGFKSSGYLRLIENQALLKHLTTLFTAKLPFESKADENFYDKRRADFITSIGTKGFMDSNKTVHISQLLGDPAVRFQIAIYGQMLHERIQQKKKLATDIQAVVAEIDRELNK